MNREMVFERFLDNLELYFSARARYTKRVEDLYARHQDTWDDTFKLEDELWEERDTLDTLRHLVARALDEYMGRGDDDEARPSAGGPGTTQAPDG